MIRTTLAPSAPWPYPAWAPAKVPPVVKQRESLSIEERDRRTRRIMRLLCEAPQSVHAVASALAIPLSTTDHTIRRLRMMGRVRRINDAARVLDVHVPALYAAVGAA